MEKHIISYVFLGHYCLNLLKMTYSMYKEPTSLVKYRTSTKEDLRAIYGVNVYSFLVVILKQLFLIYMIGAKLIG